MSNRNNHVNMSVKPFLKWVGGKSQLIKIIESKFPDKLKENKKIEEYFEPFVGGGALFFHIISNYDISKSYISDTNEDLILTYKVIRKNPEELISKLSEIKSNFIPRNHEERQVIYYDIRTKFNNLKTKINYNKYSKKHIQQAAYLIFLNKTCFNGIFRVNSNGFFNVPMGRYKNPAIYDETNIYGISDKIQETIIVNQSYDFCKELITDNSLVYLDPPYRPITETSFTSYTKSNFNDDDQIKLAKFFKDLDEIQANVILSNSDPHNMDKDDDFFDELYSEYYIERIPAMRYVNRDGNNRGYINEILVRNYTNKK